MIKKIVVCTMATWYIILTLCNYVSGMSWRLVMYDCRTGFRDNPSYFSIFFAPITMLCIVFNVVIILMLERKISMHWQVKVGKHVFELGELNSIRKYRRFICLVLAVCAMFIFILSVGNRIIQKHGDIWGGSKTVAHAGGRIDEYDYSNCVEAICQNYEKGQRVFEIDLSLTSDNKLVGKHDWYYVVQEGGVYGEVWDEERFLSVPIFGKYEPLSLARLFQIMEEYPDMWIVTDTRDTEEELVRCGFETMVNTAKELGKEAVLDRVIVQIYNEEMYDIVQKVYPFESYIYTLYQFFGGDAETFRECVRFCYDHNINGIATWNYYVTPELLQIADEYGIDYYAHTEDDVENAKLMIKQGLTGVYTNILTPEMLEED